MTWIKGETVQILTRKASDAVDYYGQPVDEEVAEDVENVLITPVSSDDAGPARNAKGERVVYELSIPKTDSHDWRNVRVFFRGEYYKTLGEPLEYHSALVPLDWNRKVRVMNCGEGISGAEFRRRAGAIDE